MKVFVSLCGVMIGSAFLISAAQAQVLPDGSLNTTVNTVGNNFTIDSGTTSGTNLFHSFREFSIPTGGGAIFNNAPTIQNIFSRVTGGTVSNIDGTIQANGTANLFLLNPSGILFGANASLNIGGSFVGTTAQSIKFADGVEFSTTNPAPLLTMSVPIGLQMGQSSGNINVQGSGHQLMGGSFTPIIRNPSQISTLQVSSGNTIALIGQDVTLVDAVLTAENGRIEVGGVKAGTVGLSQTNTDLQLDYQNVNRFGDIHLREQSLVDTSGFTSRGIRLQGQNISLTEGSTALIQTLGGASPHRLQVNAAGSLYLSGDTRIAPDAGIVTGVISSRLMTETLGSGKGPNIDVVAGDLQLRDGGIILARTYGLGNGGEININVTDDIQINRTANLNPGINSGIATTTFSAGQSGNVNVTAANITVTDGGLINSTSFGAGKSGDLSITASGTISLKGIDLNTAAPSNIGSIVFRQGDGGNVNLIASSLIVEDGSTLSTATLNQGDGGNMNIDVSDSIAVRGSALGGALPSNITASALTLPLVLRQQFGLPDRPTGNAGDVTITADSVKIEDNGRIDVRNTGQGNGGRLSLNADSVRLDQQGLLAASTDSGEGGNIQLNVQSELILRNQSLISTAAKGTGNGGNILLNIPIILGLENSDIVANAEGGRGGNIDITTQGIIGLKFRNTLTPRQDPTNDITASSQFNVNGSVQINNIGVDPHSGLVALPVDLVDPSQQIAKGCDSSQGSSFVVTGRGGIPNNPSQKIDIDRPWSDLRTIASIVPARSSNVATISATPLTEATTWQRNAQGQPELIADRQLNGESRATTTCAR